MNKRIESVHLDQGSLPGRTWVSANIFRSRDISNETGRLRSYVANFNRGDNPRAARRLLRMYRLFSASVKRQVQL